MLNITFIFDRCPRSWAAEPPVKYERDLKSLIYTLAQSKFPVTETWRNGGLVTPTNGLQDYFAATEGQSYNYSSVRALQTQMIPVNKTDESTGNWYHNQNKAKQNKQSACCSWRHAVRVAERGDWLF